MDLGIKRILKAFVYSYDGFKSGLKNETAFLQEVCLAIFLTILVFFLDVSGLERALMLASVYFILIVELLNSAFEAVVDRISLERHELSKRAKDYGSLAVLIAIINCALIWIAILSKGE